MCVSLLWFTYSWPERNCYRRDVLAWSCLIYPGLIFKILPTCDGVRERSFFVILFFFGELSRLPRERTEVIDGEFYMKLPLLIWETRSLGPGYRTLHSALNGSTRSKLGCKKANACLYLTVSGPALLSPLQSFLSRLLSSIDVLMPLSSSSYLKAFHGIMLSLPMTFIESSKSAILNKICRYLLWSRSLKSFLHLVFNRLAS